MYVGFITQLLRNHLCKPFRIKENLLSFIFLTLNFGPKEFSLFLFRGMNSIPYSEIGLRVNIFTLKK